MEDRPRENCIYYPAAFPGTSKLEEYVKHIGRAEPELPDNVVELHPDFLDVPAWLKRQAD